VHHPQSHRLGPQQIILPLMLIMCAIGLAMANRMSWGWCIGAILGIGIGFGAPQIVTWARGLFGV
jgi:type IV secretion system protein VirB2